jgi:hypothetical protein
MKNEAAVAGGDVTSYKDIYSSIRQVFTGVIKGIEWTPYRHDF